MNHKESAIQAAQETIKSLGLPQAQPNERSALCLLALLNLTESHLKHTHQHCDGQLDVQSWSYHDRQRLLRCRRWRLVLHGV